MKLLRFVCAALCSLLGAAMAGSRVPVDSLGASLLVPDGWVLVSKGDSRLALYDTVLDTSTYALRHGGMLELEAVRDSLGEGPRAWTLLQAKAERVFLESDPASVLYVADSMTQAGHFAMYFNYLWAPDTVVYAFQERFVGVGSTDYILRASGDTADFYQNFALYSALLDSISFNAGFGGLGLAGATSGRPRGLVASRVGGQVLFRVGAGGTTVSVTDLRGREVWRGSSRGTSLEWTPAGARAGTYVARAWREGEVVQATSFVLTP